MLGRHGRGGLKIFNALNFSYSKDLELGPMLCNGAYRGTRGNGSPLIDSLIAAYASIAVPSHTCSRKSVMQTSSVQRRVWPKFRERGQASHPNRTTILQEQSAIMVHRSHVRRIRSGQGNKAAGTYIAQFAVR